MKRRLQQRARFLLVLFALGGVLAPVVHRVQHESSQPVERAAAAERDGASWWIAGHAPQDAPCPICAFVLTACVEGASLTASADPVQAERSLPSSLRAEMLPAHQGRAPPAVA